MSSTNWNQLLTKVANQAREASKPCDYTLGTVESINPLLVRLNQKMLLNSDFFVITQTLKNARLEIGDSVFMIRKEGGQQYALIDKVVEYDTE